MNVKITADFLEKLVAMHDAIYEGRVHYLTNDIPDYESTINSIINDLVRLRNEHRRCRDITLSHKKALEF